MEPNKEQELSILYQRARHEWDERIGTVVAQAHNWKIATFASLAITLTSVLGVVYIGSQSKIEPYAVAIRNSEAIPIGKLNQMPIGQLNALHVAKIKAFVENIRSVLVDVAAQKKLLTQAYAMLAPNTPALMDLDRYFKSHNIFERAQTELVTVDVTSVLPISENTFQVEWTEVTTPRQGNVLPFYKKYKATMNTFTVLPTTEAALSANPLGFFIRTFNYVEIQ